MLALPPLSMTERVATRLPQEGWWGMPTRNTLDRATCMLPALLHERMPEIGVDFTVLYPTMGFGIAGYENPDLRRGLCRGFNTYFADTYQPYHDRMTVAGVIPMHHPEEALAELEHCHRPRPEGGRHSSRRDPPDRRSRCAGQPSPYVLPGRTHWFDTYGLDSEYDYDPVWQALRDLGFAVTLHGGLTHRALHLHVDLQLHLQPPRLFRRAHASAVQVTLSRRRHRPLPGAAHRVSRVRRRLGRPRCSSTSWSTGSDATSPPSKRSIRTTWTSPYWRDCSSARARAMKTALAGTGGLGELKALGGPAPEDLDELRHLPVDRARTFAISSSDPSSSASRQTTARCRSDSRAPMPSARDCQSVFSSDIAHWDVEDIGRGRTGRLRTGLGRGHHRATSATSPSPIPLVSTSEAIPTSSKGQQWNHRWLRRS